MPHKTKKTIIVTAKVKDGKRVHAFMTDIRGRREPVTRAIVGRNGIRWNI